ncbi:MAG: hypothetical protein B1H03_01505 [Planctomycetales bacterium 4484_113]|nr:MAG: hypothetical protein B1H03_01505 [Planctomycetales bacterium 4484_113]
MNRVSLGILLIVIGVLSLSAYLFGSALALAVYWPILLVLYGVILLDSERTAYAVGMMLVGIILLADNLLPLPPLGRLGDFWPLLLIILGIFLILGVTQATHERERLHVVSSPEGAASVTIKAEGRTAHAVKDDEGVRAEAASRVNDSTAPISHETPAPTERAGGESSEEEPTPPDVEEGSEEAHATAERIPLDASYKDGRGHFSVNLPADVDRLRYELHLSAGRMKVAGTTDRLIEIITDRGSCEPRFELQVSERDGKKVAHLRVIAEHVSSRLPILAGSVWEVRLNRQLPLALDVEANAAKCELELTELAVEEVHLENNAAHTQIRLGERLPEVTMNLMNNAAKLELQAPEGFAFDAQVVNHLGHHNLTDFPIHREDERYISQGYESSDRRLKLQVSNNAANFELKLV